MATSELIDMRAIADLLGVCRFALCKSRAQLTDFPPVAKKQGKQMLFNQADVLAWADGRDLKADLKRFERERRKPKQAFNSHAKQFLTGAYLPPAAKHAADFKKLVARTTKPKTTRIKLVHDWMLEDGPRATHRRAS